MARRFAVVAFFLAINRPALAAPTVSLLAVEKNGRAIRPTSRVVAAQPGDVYTCEFYIGDWGRWLSVDSFEVDVAGREAVDSGKFGLVLPVGWDAPPDPLPPNAEGECTDPRYPVLDETFNLCVGTNRHPALGSFIDFSRPDYIFHGNAGITVVARASLNYKYGALSRNLRPVRDTGESTYAGTLRLEVGPEACGTFVFDMLLAFIAGPYSYLELAVEPLTIHVATEPCPRDCNKNQVRDLVDIWSGFSSDCDENNVPDECQEDSDYDGIPDDCDP